MQNAWLVSFIRIPMLLIALIIFSIVLQWMGIEITFPFTPDLSVVYFTFVNILCFVLMISLLKREGRSLKDVVGYRSERLGKDILFGFLWVFLLYIPFVAAVMGTMFLMYGTEFSHHFETVFAGDVTNYPARPLALMWFAAVLSLLFPFLNAPIEEIMYRGYAQSMFVKKTKKIGFSILIPSIGFAIQHVLLAASWQGAIVYMAAFFLWGIGSGIIYHKQGRLFPLIICHFIVNIAFSIFPLLFLVLGLY